ncbi:cytochrome c3 family protein [Sphingomonas sp. LB-2]|uniref:cytochrome c3 family protein n=1 Tax=Sphingomonas caeni TaxID=2984949 RepID=UPI0022305F27|nr:cytochrome c3 family protein [Sphingomonas caeni]MCW3849457.1 cytochrome c3 family protein [Sphingomonas caeni]
MAFLIRSVTQTADHREIVRDTRIDKEVLGIGRAAENEVSLPDLSVDPRHARIEARDGRRIAVIANGTLGFEVDGRSTRSTTIDSGRGAELAFGGHRITVGHEGADVVLTVRRVDAVSDAEEERDEARAFSLRGKLPGRRLTAWLLVAAVLLGFLAVPVWTFMKGPEKTIYEAQAQHSWSSGPLSAAHHQLEGNCESCHVQAFVSVRDSACASCHKDVHDHAPPERIGRARAKPTAWGSLLQAVAKTFGKPGPGACVDCHTEHEGAGRMAETKQAFCTDCHSTLSQRLADTKLPNAGDFGTAHPEFRPTYGQGRVAIGAQIASGLKFPHDLHLNTRGGVARMAQTLRGRYPFGDALDCKDCHRPDRDGVRFQPVEMESSCGMCHSLAYDNVGGTVRTLRHGDVAQAIADLRASTKHAPRPPALDGGRRRPGEYQQGRVYSAYFGPASQRGSDYAVRLLFSQNGACAECHTITPVGNSWTVAPVVQPGRYLMHGWFDHAAHATETCTSCHKAGTSGASSDLLLPGIETCRTCHGGENSRAKVPSSCAMCHSYHIADGAPWAPSRPVGRTTEDAAPNRGRERR